MPTYNGVDRLGPVLERVRAEISSSAVDAEVLVIDDRSTDNTAEQLARLADNWPALKLLKGEGRGPGAARNFGVANAQAALVAFADDDDLWATGKLERQLRLHDEHPKAAMSVCDYGHVREGEANQKLPSAFAYWPNWRKYRGREVTFVHDARPLIAAENAVGTSTVVVRRDCFLRVGGFDTSLPSASDWDLWLRLAQNDPILILGMEGASYAMRAGSVSSNRSNRIAAMREILARHPDLPAWSRRSAEARIETCMSESAEEDGHMVSSIEHALRSLFTSPSSQQTRRCLGLLRRAI